MTKLASVYAGRYGYQTSLRHAVEDAVPADDPAVLHGWLEASWRHIARELAFELRALGGHVVMPDLAPPTP